jgi:hypothetical protein
MCFCFKVLCRRDLTAKSMVRFECMECNNPDEMALSRSGYDKEEHSNSNSKNKNNNEDAEF